MVGFESDMIFVVVYVSKEGSSIMLSRIVTSAYVTTIANLVNY